MSACHPAEVRIGTSGWNYDAWRDGFYGDCPKTRWLAFCAQRFGAIEVNATFYRLQSVATFRRWRDTTPPEFRFAIKANRYLTHHRKLIDPLPSIRLERSRAAGLGDKLAAVLWQLPPHWHCDPARLAAFAKALRHWRTVRHAIEFRDASWFNAEVAGLLHEHGLANCLSDAADWPRWDALTTDLVYLRLHGRDVTYASGYTDAELADWAARIRAWQGQGRAVQCYFDNDALGRAPLDALRLTELLAQR